MSSRSSRRPAVEPNLEQAIRSNAGFDPKVLDAPNFPARDDPATRGSGRPVARRGRRPLRGSFRPSSRIDSGQAGTRSGSSRAVSTTSTSTTCARPNRPSRTGSRGRDRAPATIRHAAGGRSDRGSPRLGTGSSRYGERRGTAGPPQPPGRGRPGPARRTAQQQVGGRRPGARSTRAPRGSARALRSRRRSGAGRARAGWDALTPRPRAAGRTRELCERSRSPSAIRLRARLHRPACEAEALRDHGGRSPRVVVELEQDPPVGGIEIVHFVRSFLPVTPGNRADRSIKSIVFDETVMSLFEYETYRKCYPRFR